MTRLQLRMALLAAALGAFAAVPAPAASFDCSAAGSPVEHMICDDTALSRLDEALADAYRQALAASAEPDDLRAQQKRWLEVRRDTCRDKSCLMTAYQQRVDWLEELGGFAAANGLSEEALEDFLRAELDLPPSAFTDPSIRHFMFAPIRSPAEPAARWIAVAASWVAAQPHLGIVDVSGERPRVVSWEPYECNCQSIGSLRSTRLVAAEADFIIADYAAMSGTCNAFVPMDILRVDEQGAITRVWQGTTYEAGGTLVQVGDIRFTLRRHGTDRDILRTVRATHCEDGCLCSDGALIREYVELYVWDPLAGRFRPAE
ncbi:MAG: DUF1311 domain-containing protein [Inquilinus sp.]|nr:DUF1311 domain-containing protein [Inquilinus sp.]